jgi:hypothetical protein
MTNKRTSNGKGNGNGKGKSKSGSEGKGGLGDKRTVVRVSHCLGLLASATLLERAVRENTL